MRQLTPLMGLSSGRAEIIIGLINGPVATDHPDLAPHNFRELLGLSEGHALRRPHRSQPTHPESKGTVQLRLALLPIPGKSAVDVTSPSIVELPIFAQYVPGQDLIVWGSDSRKTDSGWTSVRVVSEATREGQDTSALTTESRKH